MSRIAFVLLLSCLASPAGAVTYKCTLGPDEPPLYTDNTRRGRCVRLAEDPGVATQISLPQPAGAKSKAASGPSPADFPKVDKTTQNRRDDKRRTLLMEERQQEETALARVRTQLDDRTARAPQERSRLQESLRLHQRNIEMLDKELARIK
ncbi:MAG: hypothetical protein ACOZB0_06170 [Pseudomonadota bacterium]